MENLLVVAIIIGIVKAIKENVPQVNGLVTMAVAVAIGAVAGYFNLEGLTVLSGIYIGLGAVGIVTIAKTVGKK